MNIQFKKGVLELCVLSLLRSGDRYGYDIAGAFVEKLDISEGSIYPILRRLKQDEYVSSYLKESSGGPPRKYYQLTPKGWEFQKELNSEWIVFTGRVDEILREGSNGL